jgi:hypothetical protein
MPISLQFIDRSQSVRYRCSERIGIGGTWSLLGSRGGTSRLLDCLVASGRSRPAVPIGIPSLHSQLYLTEPPALVIAATATRWTWAWRTIQPSPAPITRTTTTSARTLSRSATQRPLIPFSRPLCHSPLIRFPLPTREGRRFVRPPG